jgi:hypothetical protein
MLCYVFLDFVVFEERESKRKRNIEKKERHKERGRKKILK